MLCTIEPDVFGSTVVREYSTSTAVQVAVTNVLHAKAAAEADTDFHQFPLEDWLAVPLL